MNRRSAPEFLVVGHVTVDRQPDGGWLPGGPALYAASTAARLGLRAAILTSASSDEPLSDLPDSIEIVRLPSRRTTEFINTYSGETRRQRVTSVADNIRPADVPERLKRSAIVLLAPAIGEVAPGTRSVFKGLVGIAAQGWLRKLEGGQVCFKPWTADEALAGSRVVFASVEDAATRTWPGLIRHWLSMVSAVCITEGSRGGRLFIADREVTRWSAPKTRIIDPTGAGDVFAAAFLARYAETSDPYEAAAFAAAAASWSVEGDGISAIADRVTVRRRLEGANG